MTYFNFLSSLSPLKFFIFLGKGILCNKSCINPKGQINPHINLPKIVQDVTSSVNSWLTNYG